MAEVQRGAVSFTSTADDGTCFTLTLPADHARARALGAHDFRTKPVDLEHLRASLHAALGGAAH